MCLICQRRQQQLFWLLGLDLTLDLERNDVNWDCNFNDPDVILGSMDLRNGAYLWAEEDNEINFLVRGVLLV